jgi:hypothetical protein
MTTGDYVLVSTCWTPFFSNRWSVMLNQLNKESMISTCYSRLERQHYCEIIINHGVLIFMNFMVHLNHKNYNLMKYNFPLTVACSIWNYEFKNSWISASCINHEFKKKANWLIKTYNQDFSVSKNMTKLIYKSKLVAIQNCR